MKHPAIWLVTYNGTHYVCPVCDVRSVARKVLEEDGKEWTCAPCKPHTQAQARETNKIQEWLDKQNRKSA